MATLSMSAGTRTRSPPNGAPPDDGGGRGCRACHLCNASLDGTPFHPASSCPKAADFQAFIEQRAQLVEQIKSVENKDRATTAPVAAGTNGKYSVCPSNTSVPFAFARNHATQSSLPPTRRVLDEGGKPVLSCEFIDFTAYMALPQVDGASGEDHPPEMEEDWVHVGHEVDVQEAGIDPEGRKETITDSISASSTSGNVATIRGKSMYWPENGKPHQLADCACHT